MAGSVGAGERVRVRWPRLVMDVLGPGLRSLSCSVSTGSSSPFPTSVPSHNPHVLLVVFLSQIQSLPVPQVPTWITSCTKPSLISCSLPSDDKNLIILWLFVFVSEGGSVRSQPRQDIKVETCLVYIWMGINCKDTWEHKEREEKGLISRKGPALWGWGVLWAHRTCR